MAAVVALSLTSKLVSRYLRRKRLLLVAEDHRLRLAHEADKNHESDKNNEYGARPYPSTVPFKNSTASPLVGTNHG